MRNTIYLAMLFGLFCCAACSKTTPGFDMLYRRTFDLPIGLDPFALHNFAFKDISTDTALIFKANNATSDKITRIEPKTMILRGLFVAGNYGFIEKAEVRISTATLGEQIIFFRDQIPFNTGEKLDLIPNNVDVKPYLMGGKFNVRMILTLRDSPPKTFETEVPMTFFAKI
jgi:hypothetical protein